MLKTTLRLVLLVAIFAALPVFPQGVYHEGFCPSVDTARMTRLKRAKAEAIGLLPAPDCHPHVRVLNLGQIPGDWSAAPAAERPDRVQVRGHTRSDGTYVRPHTRSYPRRD